VKQITYETTNKVMATLRRCGFMVWRLAVVYGWIADLLSVWYDLEMTGFFGNHYATLPGGILISRVDVYSSMAPDGKRSGTPHIHLACDEMYYGLRGTGFVELISYDGFERRPVTPGDAVCFTPGTIHRAINPNGDLVILVIMQNKGLPERGDVAFCFPHDTLSSEPLYRQTMFVDDEGSAQRRRDLGVLGFNRLKQAFDESLETGRHLLDEFYHFAIQRTRDQYFQWRRVIEQGPHVEVKRSQQILDVLEDDSIESLQLGRAFTANPTPQTTLGYCGHIHAYAPSQGSRYTAEGIRDE